MPYSSANHSYPGLPEAFSAALQSDAWIPFGSSLWGWFLSMLLLARAFDLLSTWIATPNLAFEGNPLMRRLGWRIGLPLNLAFVLIAACWPMLTISLTTTSLLVSARNLQSAWLIRSHGQDAYRRWMSERLTAGSRLLAWACFLGEAAMFASIGVALMWVSRWQLLPFSIGLGILVYAGAVAMFMTLSIWRR